MNPWAKPNPEVFTTLMGLLLPFSSRIENPEDIEALPCQASPNHEDPLMAYVFMWKQLGPEEALLTTIGFGDSHSSPPVAGATQGGHRISTF